jgi:hypothetical protein
MVIIEAGPRRANKSHQCEWCGELIKRRENLVHYAIAYDGQIFHMFDHPECDDAKKRSDIDWNNDDDEPYTLYAQKRGKTLQEREARK